MAERWVRVVNVDQQMNLNLEKDMTEFSGPKIVQLHKDKEQEDHAGRYLLQAIDRMELAEEEHGTFVVMFDTGTETRFASNANSLEEASGYMMKASTLFIMDTLNGGGKE